MNWHFLARQIEIWSWRVHQPNEQTVFQFFVWPPWGAFILPNGSSSTGCTVVRVRMRLAAGGWRLAAGGERRCTAGGLAIGATVALIGGSFGGTWAFNRPTAILVRGVVSAVFGRDRHTANCTAIPLSSTPFPSWWNMYEVFPVVVR